MGKKAAARRLLRAALVRRSPRVERVGLTTPNLPDAESYSMPFVPFGLIVVLVVLMLITCVMLVAMELHQAATTRAAVELRLLLATKRELRTLRKALAMKDGAEQRIPSPNSTP
jgi:hypothetical protein